MLQSLLNGTIQGLLFAVLGIAFSLVYSTTRVFHIALGATFSLVPYLLLGSLHSGFHWALGGLFALLVAAALGIGAEEFIHWPLVRRRAPDEVHFISSLGAFLLIGPITVLIWGNDPKVFRTGIDAIFEFDGLRVTGGQAIGVVVASVGLAGTFAWLRWTEVGLQFRALASNPLLLSILGRDIRGLRRAVFGLSGGLVAAVALAIGRDVGFDPNTGMKSVLVGVAATIVGGRGSFAGAAIAGVLLGILRAQIVWHFSARWEEAATFLVLAAFLLAVPGGLKGLGPSRKNRVEEIA